MPKPVKKRGKSKDPNELAFELVRRTAEIGERDSDQPFAARLSAYMSKLGRKGGKESGRRRMQNLTDEQRREIALKAARARWARARWKKAEAAKRRVKRPS